MIYLIASPIHIASAVAALLLGACVLLLKKGTRLHRKIGYGYVFSMAMLNISSFFIYRLFGVFGPFHGAAFASFVTLIAGFIPAYRRLPRGRWLDLHYQFMNWSYAGLLAAGASEIATRAPDSPFWPAVLISSILIFAVSGYLIFRRDPRDLLHA